MKKRSRIWQPLFLAIVLAVGFSVAWAFVVTFGGSLFHVSRQYKGITILPDETLAILSYNSYGQDTYETLDGRPIEAPDDYLRSVFHNWSYANRTKSWEPLPWTDRFVGFSDDFRKPNTIWYLIYNGQLDGNAYFVGYDLRSRLCIGYLGRNGFQHKMPSVNDRFPVHGKRGLIGMFVASGHARSFHFAYQSYTFNTCFSGRGPCYEVYLRSGDELLRVNLRNRSVHLLSKIPGLCDIEGVGNPSKNLPPESPQRQAFGQAMFAARTNSEILLLDADGKEVRRWTIPKSLLDKTFLFFPLSKTRGTAQFQHQFHREPVTEYDYVWFDNQGIIEKEKSPTLPSYSPYQDSPWFIGTVVPVPALLVPDLLYTTADEYLASGESDDWPSAVSAALADKWPPMVFLVLLSAILAWLCWRRQNRFDQHWTWVWVIFILLFGLPAMVGYLFHRRWPAIEPCPNCRKEAPRDRPACYACGQDFPRPAMKGTEVFA